MFNFKEVSQNALDSIGFCLESSDPTVALDLAVTLLVVSNDNAVSTRVHKLLTEYFDDQVNVNSIEFALPYADLIMNTKMSVNGIYGGELHKLLKSITNLRKRLLEYGGRL